MYVYMLYVHCYAHMPHVSIFIHVFTKLHVSLRKCIPLSAGRSAACEALGAVLCLPTCDSATGTCTCTSGSLVGFWTGTNCDACLAPYSGTSCTLLWSGGSPEPHGGKSPQWQNMCVHMNVQLFDCVHLFECSIRIGNGQELLPPV